MGTVEEYVRMAEKAGEDNAHVAASMNYRNAIEGTGYNPNAAPILLAFMQYGQRFKKDVDKKAVAEWGQKSLGKIVPKTDLEEAITREITKLQTGGKKDASA